MKDREEVQMSESAKPLRLTIHAGTPAREEWWARKMLKALAGLDENAGEKYCLESGGAPDAEPGQVVFVEAAMKNLEKTLGVFKQDGRVIVLLSRDNKCATRAFRQPLADDVLVAPLRPLELVTKLKLYARLLAWSELKDLNASFAGILARFREDLALTERLQIGRLPVRFEKIPGFRVTSRYLAGVRPGGDYFDLAESRHGSQLSIVATDASTYGMSSAVLSALVSVSLKLTADEVRSCVDTVRSIHREMIATLGEKDRLALFYATVSRKDYKMRYLNLGSFGVFHAPAGSGFRRLQPQGGPLARVSSMGLAQVKEVEVALNPDDRIVLLSDGYVEAIAGPGIEQEASVLDLLNRFREKDPKELTNELTFLVKKTLLPEDELPNQDCTALIFDGESKIIRLAS